MDDFAIRCYAPYLKKEKLWQGGDVRSYSEHRVLVMDMETRITEDQDLTQGSAGLWIKGKLIKFYLIYNELLPPREMHVVRAIAREQGCELLSKTEFVEQVFFPEVYDAGTILVCFNAPFDISRLGTHFTYSKKKRFRGGFSIRLSDNPEQPSILIKNLDSKRSFIEFARPSHHKQSDKKRPTYKGCFRDEKTMLYALTGKAYTLDMALQDFGLGEKSNKAEYGVVTVESVRDNIQHTKATYALYLKIVELYQIFNVDKPLEQLFSPASVGKAYLDQMGVQPFLDAHPDFPQEKLGQAMGCYFGGRSEVRHRIDPILVTLLDATGMYPSVFDLQGMDDFLKARDILVVENTVEIQKLIDGFSLADLFDKAFWKRLPAIVLIKPDEDILPLRSQYAKKLNLGIGIDVPRTIGINYVTSIDGAVPYALQDILADKILGRKVPKIELGISFVPEGTQYLQDTKIINNILIKPSDRILKKIIEERQKTKKQMDAMLDKTCKEYKRLDQIQNGLKTIANSISYGIYLQLDKEPEKAIVDVYGLTHYKSRVEKVEKPGPMFNPLIGINQTAGARLILAAIEAWLYEHNGYYTGCDTDSMFVSPEHARQLQDYFQPLSPYDDPTIKMLKIEKQKLKDGSDGPPLDNVWYYGISAKRYALFKFGENGEIVILKYSSHGLGQLRLDEEEWWRDIIEVHYHPELLESKLDKYRFRVAAYQLTISNYDTWKMFDNYNEGKPVSKKIKPFNFITVGSHRLRDSKTGEPIIPVVPYVDAENKDFNNIPYREFFDKRTGERYTNPPAPGKLATPSYWNTLADVFIKYINHPEAKSMGDVGRLERRHMIISTKDVAHIGKESDELEESLALGENPKNTTEYAEIDRTKVKILTVKPSRAVKGKVPRSTFYYARKKTLNGEAYTPQKRTKKRIKGL